MDYLFWDEINKLCYEMQYMVSVHIKREFDEKKEADISDLSEINRENITAQAIR